MNQLVGMREVVRGSGERAQRWKDDQLGSIGETFDVVRQLAHDQQIQRVQCEGHSATRRHFQRTRHACG